MIKPPIKTLLPVRTSMRVEMLSNCPMAPENSEVFPFGSVAVAVARWLAPICEKAAVKEASPLALVVTFLKPMKICPSP